MAGQRLSIDGRGEVTSNIRDLELARALERDARAALAATLSRESRVDEGTEAFIEILSPPVHLLVFGAGNDAIPLVTIAKTLGWRVSVFDGRSHYARREKFPEADEVVLLNGDRFEHFAGDRSLDRCHPDDAQLRPGSRNFAAAFEASS